MDDDVTSMVERFLNATTTNREAKNKIDDTDYLSMLWRMVRAYERRAIDNPELLPQTVALAQRLSEITNVVIASNAERFSIDPRRGASLMECARILGVSKQAASQRRATGKAVIAARTAAAGAIPFAEAKRERNAIAAAAEHAITSLAEWRARKSA